jgi:methylase of polypeptide subunit release factors
MAFATRTAVLFCNANNTSYIITFNTINSNEFFEKYLALYTHYILSNPPFVNNHFKEYRFKMLLLRSAAT